MRDNELEVWYRAVDFPVLGGKVTKRLVFSIDALAHALFITGRAPGDTARHGLTSSFEWLHRVSLIPAYLRRHPNGWVMRSDLARELDRSEKVALSYTLGQGLTGIFSTHVLSVRFLMHIDRYGGSHGIVVAPRTKRRADFFGQRHSGGWVVAEAKGRSNPIDSSLKRSMRAQKRTVRSIGGEIPEITYGCAAYFEETEAGVERLCVYAVDPEEDEPEAVDLRVDDPDSFIVAYYTPFLAALEAGEPVEARGGNYLTASFGPYGLQVSLLRPVAERVREAQRGRLRGLRDDVIELLGPFTEWESPAGHFADGTRVATKWASSLGQDDWGGITELW
ncbi:hypothetical protein [Streptomyces sp. F63]|uniref:hypothetical protein n=1 Tax=Streptomyces sp. F63 TaxID=2824887 RepID=UPI001B37155E|nr:hypothetical protein [Streptomyces sp. F63]